MTSSNKSLQPLRKRIQSLSDAERRDKCWEVGYFQAPMFVKEPGGSPIKPYLLVCIDAVSRAVLGDQLLLDTPSPQEFLSLLVASMENPSVGTGAPVVPLSVHLDNSGAFKLLRDELGQLGVEVELVKRLPFLREFKGITEREFFSRQIGYTRGEN